ncbi:hypothetical protein NHN26_15380, partial [Rhodovulum tesquicola]|nr:hypothetical protein [Rhodovulum tesquicola]
TLRHEAETLQGLVARFRLQGGAPARPAQPGAMTPLRLVDPARQAAGRTAPASPGQTPAAAPRPAAEPAPRKKAAANDLTTWQDF